MDACQNTKEYDLTSFSDNSYSDTDSYHDVQLNRNIDTNIDVLSTKLNISFI